MPPRKEIPLQSSAACRADRDIRAERKRSVVTFQNWMPAGERLGREARIGSAHPLSGSYRRSSRQNWLGRILELVRSELRLREAEPKTGAWPSSRDALWRESQNMRHHSPHALRRRRKPRYVCSGHRSVTDPWKDRTAGLRAFSLTFSVAQQPCEVADPAWLVRRSWLARCPSILRADGAARGVLSGRRLRGGGAADVGFAM